MAYTAPGKINMALFKFFKSLFRKSKRKKSSKQQKKHLKKHKKTHKKKIRKISSKVYKKSATKKRKTSKPKVKKIAKANKRKTSEKRVRLAALKQKEIGIITHYFDKISVGIIKLKAPLAVGEHICIKGNDGEFTQVISSMQYNHKDIVLARKGLEIGIKVSQPVKDKDLVFRI